MRQNFLQSEVFELARREGKGLREGRAGRFHVTLQTVRRGATRDPSAAIREHCAGWRTAAEVAAGETAP